MSIVTVAEAVAVLGGVGGKVTIDAVTPYVDAATLLIESLVGPVDVSARTYVTDGGLAAIVLPSAPVAVTSITVDGALVAATGYDVDTAAGIVYPSAAFASGRANVSIAYTVGTATVPPNVKLATLELIQHMWSSGRQNRSGGQVAAAADTESPYGFAIPRRVVELCSPHMRAGGFA